MNFFSLFKRNFLYHFKRKINIDLKDIETHFALLKRTAKKENVEFFRVTSGDRKRNNALKLLEKAVKNINKETIRIDNALKHEILSEKKELYITNYKKVKELLEESTYLKLISKDRSTKIFNYFINDEYQPGSVELTRKKIFIINLSEELKEKLVHDLKDVTSEVNDNESIRLSESWINKSLVILS